MQKFVCINCDNLECETSICPVCGKNAKLINTAIFYCHKCNTPVFNDVCPSCNSNCVRVGSNLRPVFAEERLLLEILLEKPFCFANKSVWCVGASNYIIDGIKTRFSFSDFSQNDPKVIIEKLKKFQKENGKYILTDLTNENIKKFIKYNEYRLNLITDEAIEYIKDISRDFDLSSIFVSFSGGKDSSVISSLVMKALGTESVMHIYGDTTLEYPSTGEYIKHFRNKFPKTPLLVAKNGDQDLGIYVMLSAHQVGL